MLVLDLFIILKSHDLHASDVRGGCAWDSFLAREGLTLSLLWFLRGAVWALCVCWPFLLSFMRLLVPTIDFYWIFFFFLSSQLAWNLLLQNAMNSLLLHIIYDHGVTSLFQLIGVGQFLTLMNRR
jgi:hypothetical protein